MKLLFRHTEFALINLGFLQEGWTLVNSEIKNYGVGLQATYAKSEKGYMMRVLVAPKWADTQYRATLLDLSGKAIEIGDNKTELAVSLPSDDLSEILSLYQKYTPR